MAQTPTDEGETAFLAHEADDRRRQGRGDIVARWKVLMVQITEECPDSSGVAVSA